MVDVCILRSNSSIFPKLAIFYLILVPRNVMFWGLKKHTWQDKMGDTREYFNAHACVAMTAVYYIYTYIS